MARTAAERSTVKVSKASLKSGGLAPTVTTTKWGTQYNFNDGTGYWDEKKPSKKGGHR